jgi:radical SAM superfamily enzyme YgiQ (UPF0313 family)
MKVAFVKPNMGRLSDGRPYRDHACMEPLTLAVLAGMLPPGDTAVLYDDRLAPVPFDDPVDLVAITVEIYTARRAYEIAAAFRRRGVPVVLGGYHVGMVPEEAAGYADAVVIGDAEGVWPRVVDDARRGQLQRVYRAVPATAITGAAPDVALYRGARYLPLHLTQFSRGCPNRCEYCATAALYDGAHRHRPVDEVIAELTAHPAPLLFFVDDNLTAHPDARELLRRLIPLRRRWVGQASLDFTRDPELVDLVRRSGCAGLVIGFESLEAANLRQMGKACNAAGVYDDALAVIRRMGLMVWAAMLLGYDADTPASIRATVAWTVAQKFCFAAFNILTPYPATPLYDRLRAEGRLRYDRWWLHPDYHFGDAVFHPARMTADALTDLGFEARRTFNHPWSIARRLCDPRTNAKDPWSVLTYLLYNPLFRREVFTKHGMQLGYAAEPVPPQEEVSA